MAETQTKLVATKTFVSTTCHNCQTGDRFFLRLRTLHICLKSLLIDALKNQTAFKMELSDVTTDMGLKNSAYMLIKFQSFIPKKGKLHFLGCG